MDNFVDIKYQQTGASVCTNRLGMREMQMRVYEKFASQYLLVKAPPASGKSRALMFVALEKLKKGQVKKVIVAVPERSIGSSFSNRQLTELGFHSDWMVDRKYDLCTPGDDRLKSVPFDTFLKGDGDGNVLLCTHAALLMAYGRNGIAVFNDCLIGIDEFHHVSCDSDSKLGEFLRTLMHKTNAHVMAMTGSYFRGDCNAVLSPRDEQCFDKVTYNYYEQLNGYKYLKSLGIGFHFYTGAYTSALTDSTVLDLDKKTIIYIPNVNSAESIDKYRAVDKILDCIGSFDYEDDNGIYHLNGRNGKSVLVADLVNDGDPAKRNKVMSYLRGIKHSEDIDIIIALQMAKEGFDWPYCESTLTIGYRGSLTEIVQIIGRCTRDSENKTHAQFTNLVAEPSANREEIVESVNNILKAITASLLMEEVVAPKYNFKPKETESVDGENVNTNGRDIYIRGFRGIKSENVKDIIKNDLMDLKAGILQDPDIVNAIPQGVPGETVNNGLIPKVIKERYPTLTKEEIAELSDYVVIDAVLAGKDVKEINGRKFLEFANKLIDVRELNIDLIRQINPFMEAYAIMSKRLDSKVFKTIQLYIKSLRVNVTDDEAIALLPRIKEFYKTMGRFPSLDALDPVERRYAEVRLYMQRVWNERNNGGQA